MYTFEETGLRPEILKAITELGFEQPTPIQEKAIPHLLASDNDLIAFAQTGTGKTAAFSLPLIQQIDSGSKKTQALILCPTRELCMQIYKNIESFTKYMDRLHVIAVYGGTSIDPQIKALKRGGQIVVGTPGRIIDLLKRKELKIADIQWLVMDEADEMLTMGFKDDLDLILAATPPTRQTLLFSATMPKDVEHIAEKYMNSPEEINAGKRNISAENVQHQYYMVHASDRYPALKRIADLNPDIYGIVFCRTRRETKEVAEKLMQDGYNADALHGDLSQAQRDYVMNRFRVKSLQILVATDVAARGLDVNDLNVVINYNLPDDTEVYIHRSGRTGRAGKSGTSIAIIHTRERNRIQAIERKAGKKFEQKLVPSGQEICEKQLFNLIDKVENVEINESQIEKYLLTISEKLEWLSREDLIKRFVSVEFNRFLSYYKDAPDLNPTKQNRRERDRDRDRREDFGDRRKNGKRGQKNGNFARFFINLGTKDQLNASRLIGLINQQPMLNSVKIGDIDIMKKFSFFEVDSRYEKDVVKAFQGVDLDGYEVVVEPSKPKSSEGGGGRNGFKKKRRRKRPF